MPSVSTITVTYYDSYLIVFWQEKNIHNCLLCMKIISLQCFILSADYLFIMACSLSLSYFITQLNHYSQKPQLERC